MTTLPYFNMPRFRAVAARLKKGFHPELNLSQHRTKGGRRGRFQEIIDAVSVTKTLDALVNCLERSERFVSEIIHSYLEG